MKLVHNETGALISIGDDVTTFRGDTGILKDAFEPHKPDSTGRVYVQLDSKKDHILYDNFFPSVINAKWVED